jgi:hypothetical protein
MKELFSSLSATVFYPLVSLVLPGLTAISAWFVFFAQRPSLDGLVTRNHTETAFVLMLLAIFVGKLSMRSECGSRVCGWMPDANGEHMEAIAKSGGLICGSPF